MRDAKVPRPTLMPSPRRPLPFYVEPAPDEALFSWLLRLTTRMGISTHALARCSFGIDDRFGHTRWWCRPHPWLLMRISERTDIGVARLRTMTFQGLQPAYRDDEAHARFTGRRYDSQPHASRAYRFAVCGRCLKDDAKPYLRPSWLIGWMAVCPRHGTVLIDRCTCGATLRVAPFATTSQFSPATCTRCARSLLDQGEASAHPSVIRMQAALLRGKSEGITDIEGLGRFRWQEMVALADVLIGMVWTDLTLVEQERIFRLYLAEAGETTQHEDGIYDCRHGSLRFLAWLTHGWPDSPGAKIGHSLLMRWLTADRNRLCRHLRPAGAYPWSVGTTNFEPSIRERLRVLADAS
jgi:TniQ